MNEALIDALDDCLRAMEAGASLEAALARHPALAEDLRPLLATVELARPLEPLRVPHQSEGASRTRFLARARVLRSARRPAGSIFAWSSFAFRLALTALAVVIAGGLGTAGLVSASAGSLPGDALYGVKRTVEQAQLALAVDPTARTLLEDEFDRRRLAEAEAVAAQGRQVAVEFSGRVEAQARERWTIAGLSVIVPAGLGGGIGVGQTVDVAGQAQTDGTILAQRLTPRGQLTVTASPTPTQTPAPTHTRTWTAEPTESAEPEETPDPEPTESKSPTVARTATPPAAGGLSPTPQSGGGPSPSNTFEAEDTETPKPAGGGGSSPSNTPKPHTETPEQEDTDTPQPTATPSSGGGSPSPSNTPRPTETPKPEASSDPEPDETAEATETPTPEDVDFEGRVEAIGAVWVISGESVLITGDTEFRDNPQLGDRVKVRAWRYPDGHLVARRIEKD